MKIIMDICLFVIESKMNTMGIGDGGWWMYNDDDRL